ncbi:MAG TPA: histidine kinase N-terminal 7TM domain-containing protein [Bellilinea sp.]|nr:histidine kinase N-terminal 7TM domain-containing protein [Bellilinea sp.]
MNAQVIPYILLLLMVSVVSLILAAYSFIKRSIPGAQLFGMLALGIGIWSLFYLFELVQLTLRMKVLFYGLKYLGIVMIPMFLLAFVFEYTGTPLRKVTRYIPWLLFQPAFVLGLLATNHLHRWFYSSPRLEIAHSFIILDFKPEWGYYFNIYYSYALVILAMVVMLRYLIKAPPHRRMRVIIFLMGGIIPFAALILVGTGRLTLPSIDFSSTIVAGSLPFLLMSVFLYRLLDVVPEARDLVVEFMEDAVMIINGQGRILDLNPAAEKLFAVRAGETIGRPVNELLKLDEELESEVRGDKQISREVAIGETEQELQTFRLSSWYGRPAGRLITLHDITEAKQQEKSLREAKEAAEEATRAKSMFLASVSHELRTPLNAVVGMTTLLQGTDLNATQQNYVHTLQTGSSTLLDAINDILDFSKIDSDRLEIEPQVSELREIIQDAVALIAPQAEKKNLDFQMEIMPDVPNLIFIDPVRLRQVLINLLYNAVKFTDAGFVRLSAETLQRKDRELTLQFSVADSGIGIPEDKLELIFGAFQQADGSIAHKYGGSGLGLTICQQIVRLLGGSMQVESKVGEGSVFSFTVPTVEVVQDQLLTELTSSPAEPPGDTLPLDDSFARQFPWRILSVEDNPVNQRVMTQLLGRLGYTVDTAAGGKEAITMASRMPYTLIFMDVRMPDMDGLEATRILRTAAASPRPRIIAVTAFSSQSVLDECIEAGMDGSLLKPLLLDKLASVLAEKPIELIHRDREIGGSKPAAPSILDLLGDDRREVVQLLKQSVIKNYATLVEAYKKHEILQFRESAHVLKSNTGYLGAEAMTSLLRNIETSAANGMFPEYAQMQQLKTYYNRICNEQTETEI